MVHVLAIKPRPSKLLAQIAILAETDQRTALRFLAGFAVSERCRKRLEAAYAELATEAVA